MAFQTFVFFFNQLIHFRQVSVKYYLNTSNRENCLSRKSARGCSATLPVLPAVEAPKTLGRVAVVHPPPLRRIALDLRGALEGLLAKSEGADNIRSLECFQGQIFARKALQAEESAPSGFPASDPFTQTYILFFSETIIIICACLCLRHLCSMVVVKQTETATKSECFRFGCNNNSNLFRVMV